MMKIAARRTGATGVLLSRGRIVHRWRQAFWLVPMALLAGCEREVEPIKSYTATDPNRHEMRLLGALIPLEDGLIAFKLSGPKAAVDPHKDAFEVAVKSFNLKSPLTQKVPGDWQRLPRTPLTAGGYFIPGKPAVSYTLSLLQGDDSASIASNVNRWRKQLMLPPLPADDARASARTFDTDSEKRRVYFVDLVGFGSFKEPKSPEAEQPHPPARLPALPFDYELPAEWKTVANAKVITLRTFQAGENTQVTITQMPGEGGGLKSNVDRWRKFVDLPPGADGQLEKDATDMKLKFADAKLVDVANPKMDGANRIVGAIIPLGDSTWFLKMMGPSDEVGAQKENFRAFAASLSKK